MLRFKKDQYKDLMNRLCIKTTQKCFSDLPLEPCVLVATCINLFSMKVSSESVLSLHKCMLVEENINSIYFLQKS